MRISVGWYGKESRNQGKFSEATRSVAIGKAALFESGMP
jgi:hypothetical protein